jgi:adenylosuccinate synthase
MGQVRIVIGAQWGDEGKGKWIDTLAADADLVVRYQGGNNAGHTLYHNQQKLVLHHLPSGMLHENRKCYLGGGMVINPIKLLEEIDTVRKILPVDPSRLKISARAHIITPWHIACDERFEADAAHPIGTTKRGIGPTYAAKALRNGMRASAFANRDEVLAAYRYTAFQGSDDHHKRHPEVWQKFEEACAALAPFVDDVEQLVRNDIRGGANVLFEGAQGALLDIDHGTYPFVTSSSTSAAGACQSLGINPRLITQVVGISKAYTTRVGGGPFPTELSDATGKLIAERGNEFGATTGRPRRCGWLDGVALRYVAELNGLDALILNKMDILAGFPEVKLATAYLHPKFGRIQHFPADTAVLAECVPEYESFPGWPEPMAVSGDFKALHPRAREFVAAVEQFCGVRIVCVGTGPKREEAIYDRTYGAFRV